MTQSDKIDLGDTVLTNITNATIDGSGISSAGITGITSNDYFINYNSWQIQDIKPTPFVNAMPPLHEVNEMCSQYPSLAKAYENFKIVYTMVEQDWKGRNNDR